MYVSIKSKLTEKKEKKSVGTPRMEDQGGTQLKNFICSHHHFCKIHSPLMRSPIFEGYKLIRIKKSTNNVLERMIWVKENVWDCWRLMENIWEQGRVFECRWSIVGDCMGLRMYGMHGQWLMYGMYGECTECIECI